MCIADDTPPPLATLTVLVVDLRLFDSAFYDMA